MPGRERDAPRVLILGGTGEAVELAAAAIRTFAARVEVISSLAGATAEPARPPGRVRVGGFGGAEGLARYLQAESIGALIDATHPFAARMQASAVAAAKAANIPRCRLLRPPWPRAPGDRWIEVADAAMAARELEKLGPRVFIALGARDLGAFAGLAGRQFLLRAISPPSTKPPANWRFVQARGPFRLADERRLLAENQIDVMVSRQSGGQGAYAKIGAARELGLPVVMIRRPPPPPPPILATVSQALTWLDKVVGENAARSTLAEAHRPDAV